MTRAGFSRRHTSRPQMNKGSYQGTTSVVPTVALFLVGGGLQPAEVHVRVKRLRSMPKPYDPEPTPAALSEFCARARITDPTRRSAPVANPYSHTWIRINSTSSATYKQFSAKPLKINADRTHGRVAHPVDLLSRIDLHDRVLHPAFFWRGGDFRRSPEGLLPAEPLDETQFSHQTASPDPVDGWNAWATHPCFLRQLQRRLHRVLDRSHRRRRQRSQRRIDHQALLHCRRLVALDPGIVLQPSVAGFYFGTQRKGPVLRRGDRKNANVQRVRVKAVARNDYGRALFVEVNQADLAAPGIPARRFVGPLPRAHSRAQDRTAARWKARRSSRSSGAAAKKRAASSNRSALLSISNAYFRR